MKNYINLNIYHRYKEDEICDSFGVTHLVFRRAHPSPQVKLSDGCMAEIKASKSRDTEKLAKAYSTSIGQIMRAFAGQPNVLKSFSVSDVIMHSKAGMSQEAIVTLMGISAHRVRGALRKKRDPSYGDQIRTILATGLYTQSELALEMSISQSTVSYYAEEGVKRPRRPKITEQDWSALIRNYTLGLSTITELSKLYNVARSTIYKRLEKWKN